MTVASAIVRDNLPAGETAMYYVFLLLKTAGEALRNSLLANLLFAVKEEFEPDAVDLRYPCVRRIVD